MAFELYHGGRGGPGFGRGRKVMRNFGRCCQKSLGNDLGLHSDVSLAAGLQLRHSLAVDEE